MNTLAIDADRRTIVARFAGLRPDDQRLWGKMSAQQMVCHVTDSYLVVLGERTASPATGFVQRTLIKWVALRTSLRWPKGVPTRPEMEQGVGGTPPTNFDDDRQALLSALERFRADLFDLAIPHPIFGALTAEEWLRWGYLHADHHLRQFGR
jgi:uncharacterized protein DUF1569